MNATDDHELPVSGVDRPESWQRLHPLTPALRSIQLVYALAIAAVASSVGVGSTVLILIVAAAVIAAWITLAYLRFRYRVTEDSLIIQHGVLVRRRRVIPRSRIQNVDLRAGLLNQLLGVVVARIETAGGEASEATLSVVARSEATRLRRTLVTGALGAAPGPAVDAGAVEPLPIVDGAAALPSDRIVRRSTLLDLVIAGATSNRAGLLFAALLGGDYLFEFMPTDWLLRRFVAPELVQPDAAVRALIQTAERDIQAFVMGMAVVSIFFALAGWGLSIALSVIRYFEFTLVAAGGGLQVSYGLFTRREKGFRRSRVQNVQIEEPILRRWLGLTSMRVQTAGYGPGMKADERVETLTPITRRGEIPLYLSVVLPDLVWDSIEWRPSHPRARRRLFIRRALVVLLATGAVTFLTPYGLVLLAALLPAWLLATAHYRHLGHARADDYVLVREGLWNRRTYIVPVRKIQALHLRQSPLQRRLGLGTLVMDTAGSPHEWHPPRSIDLGTDYGRELMRSLATGVSATGLNF